MKVITVLTLFLVISVTAYADDVEKEIADNISHDYVECAAYFIIISEALMKANDKETSTQYKKMGEAAIEFAVTAAETGRTPEMAQKVTMARLTLSVQEMLKEIENDFSNTSILMNQYLSKCKEATENPEKMMEDWMKKILKKHLKTEEPSK